MGELLSEVGDLVFSLVVGYIGALEFWYVVRHLYHWTFRHPEGNENDVDSLKRLQESMREQLAAAEAKEAKAGANAMQDGVLYKDGFRIEPKQQQNERLKEEKEQRRKGIEAELARQKKIEEETRLQLQRAEAELERQRQQAATEEDERNVRALVQAEAEREEQQRKLEVERDKREAEESARKLLAAEKEREEADQRQREEEENAKRIAEAERAREAEQRKLEEEREAAERREKQEREDAENEKRIMEEEKLREAEQRKLDEEREAAERRKEQEREDAENEKRIIEVERLREAAQRQLEEAREAAKRQEEQEREDTENEKIIVDAERLREAEERRLEEEREATERHKDKKGADVDNEKRIMEAESFREAEQSGLEEEREAAENAQRLLEAERERELMQQFVEVDEQEAAEQAQLLLDAEREQERQQRVKEENARKFLESEQAMVELQQLMEEAVQKRQLSLEQQIPVVEEPCIKREVSPLTDSDRMTQTLKTQFGQTRSKPYAQSSKSLLFPSVSDDASSIEPTSSQQSSFGAQQSEEVTSVGDEETVIGVLGNELELEREAPDGEDNTPTIQYTDEYLRSLDGIKQRPLVREDGSGRRRAFKKRRSSGSSNSSRESRTSREEELKMFTSLEEEEMDVVKKDTNAFTSIKYSSEPTLKVKGHSKRHKRSPAKDMKTSDESLRGSLEMLGEENSDPWGEVVPEHYKDTAFWKREKAMSIDEEDVEIERPAAKDGDIESEAATNVPKTSSFEEANNTQNKEALTVLRKQHPKEKEDENRGVSDATKHDRNTNLIFSGEYTKAMNKDWHSGHFCCWQCDESLTGQRYVIRDDHPYCIGCYENVFANTCEECNKIIGIDSKDLSYKDKHWHEACFLCCKCHLSLVDKQFGAKADKIYCSTCYDSQFASRCDGCGDVFRAGTKKMEYKTRQWHEKCFCCCVCKTVIGTKSFIPREQEIYCAGCYEEKFATRCIKCNKVITSGGVTYKNEPWHRECFTCTHCNMTLAGQRFTSRDEKPYCAECFGDLFAKRCTACVKPITGIGGTRFISFEDRHWHHDCFVCASCKTSLVGRGFITDGPDIICPECAKQKLM